MRFEEPTKSYIDRKTVEELDNLLIPVMEYLNEHFGSRVTIILDNENRQILETCISREYFRDTDI